MLPTPDLSQEKKHELRQKNAGQAEKWNHSKTMSFVSCKI